MQTQAAAQQLTADPGFLLSRVGAAVRAGFKEVLAGWGVRPLQYVILLVLDTGGGASQQELCAAAGIDSGNMVELLDGLEALGYARRARDPRDRRRYVVTMTPARAVGPGRAAPVHRGVQHTAFSARSPGLNASSWPASSASSTSPPPKASHARRAGRHRSPAQVPRQHAAAQPDPEGIRPGT